MTGWEVSGQKTKDIFRVWRQPSLRFNPPSSVDWFMPTVTRQPPTRCDVTKLSSVLWIADCWLSHALTYRLLSAELTSLPLDEVSHIVTINFKSVHLMEVSIEENLDTTDKRELGTLIGRLISYQGIVLQSRKCLIHLVIFRCWCDFFNKYR